MNIFFAPWHCTRGTLIAFGLLVFFVFAANAQTGTNERRVALVVGNSAYKMGPLKNPVNDARAVAATLRSLNFEVIERQNVSREAFALSVREFGDKLKGATVGLFYFAGHGLQVKGRNFLVPVDADIAREDEVPYRSTDVNEVLDKMDSARTPINLVLLDACRNNPFARSFKLSQTGLAQMDAPSGTLIAFATSPGSVAQDGEGENGMYTAALLRHITQVSLPIEQMLKRVRVEVVRASNNSQVPWESSSLNRDFYFAPAGPVALATPLATSSADELVLELAFWDAVKTSSSAADYRAYLEQYPKGRFAALAKVRAINLTTAETKPPLQAAQREPLQALRVGSPEGIYSAVADAESIRILDAGRRTVVQIAIENAAGLTPQELQFSPDGRWLAMGGSREGRNVQLLISVSGRKVVWERAALGLTFDAQRGALQLQLASGEIQVVSLTQAVRP